MIGVINPFKVNWTPADLGSSLAAWYDAADEDTITEASGLVSQWDDKSGNARHMTQGTAANQPTTGSRQLNGLNVLDCDGGDFMAHAGFPITDFSLSVFVVAELDAIDNALDAVFSTAATKDFGLEAYNASQFDGAVHCEGASNPQYTPLSGGPFPGPSIYNALVTTTGLRIQAYVDGTIRADVGYVGGISTSVTLRLFADRTAAASPDGALAEVVVVSKATTEERQLIEGYLAWKWSSAA